MRRRWARLGVIVVAVAVAGLAVNSLLRSGPSAADIEAEFRALVERERSILPDARNGWDDLVEIGREFESIIGTIWKRETDADEQSRASGVSPEKWREFIDLSPMCPAALTERDMRLREEAFAAIEAAGLFDRLRALRTGTYFASGPGGEPVLGEVISLSGIRAIAKASSFALVRAVQRGDVAEAQERMADLVVCADALRDQPGMMPVWIAWAVEASLRDSVDRSIEEGAPPELLHQAAALCRDREVRGGDLAWQVMRLEMLDMVSDIAERKRESILGMVELAVPWYGIDRRGAMRDVQSSFARWMMLRGGGLAEAEAARDALENMPSRWSDGWASDVDAERAFAISVYIEQISEIATAAHEIVLAIALHVAAYGHPPETLDALVPEFLEALPPDPLAPDGRFRYIPGRAMADLVLYSVGIDGTDEGGVTGPKGPHMALRSKGAGFDVVFWPPYCASGSATGSD